MYTGISPSHSNQHLSKDCGLVERHYLTPERHAPREMVSRVSRSLGRLQLIDTSRHCRRSAGSLPPRPRCRLYRALTLRPSLCLLQGFSSTLVEESKLIETQSVGVRQPICYTFMFSLQLGSASVGRTERRPASAEITQSRSGNSCVNRSTVTDDDCRVLPTSV